MELWFNETYENLQAGWRVKEVLYHQRSQYQDVVILDTIPFGRMLVLDGCVMTTEVDECAYHEMLVHPGLLAHPKPEAVCVVGGGDGGTVREVLKHPTVKRVVLAEIDEDVITVSKKYLPSIAGALDDPRVELAIGDGAQYLRDHPGEFDAIFSDSTDPVGPGVVLFEDAYFKGGKSALREGGLFVTQSKGSWLGAKDVRAIMQRMEQYFGKVMAYGATIPTYPSGSWTFLLGSDTLDPRVNCDTARQAQVSKTTRYYTPAHQQGAFALPAFFYRD